MIDKKRSDAAPRYRDLLCQRTVAWAKMRIRACEKTRFHAMSFKVFDAFVLVGAANLVGELSSPPLPPARPVVVEIPGGPHYKIDGLLHPCGKVGGDWVGSDLLDDGIVWILVADVSGKDEPADMIARGVRLLWEMPSAADLRRRKCGPVEILDRLGSDLTPHLPDGVFVEATAARLDPSGNVSVGAAGATRLVRRGHGARTITLPELGGHFLGLDIPGEKRSEESWQLNPGDELLMATDGLFDQPTDNGRLGKRLVALAADHHASSLLNTIHAVLKWVWAKHPQFDDTTIVGAGFKLAP